MSDEQSATINIEGKLFHSGKIIDATIKIEDGVIKEIKKDAKGERISGLILPCAIDVHVHFRDFKENYKETIETGSLSALYGGVCLVIDQPNTNPPVDSYEIYSKRVSIANKKSYIDYSLNFGVTKRNLKKVHMTLDKIEKKLKVKVPAVGETFLAHDDPILQIDVSDLINLNVNNKLITIHAEDPNLIRSSELESPNFYTRPPEAEISALKKCAPLNKRLYFCHVTLKDSVKIIKKYNKFCEVTLHHLIFSTQNYPKYPNVNPPLRDPKQKVSFSDLNFVDVIASDHAPHLLDEKKKGLPGFPGVEVLYPILIYLVKNNVLSLDQVIKLLCINPSKIFNFKLYGEIKENKYANLAVFNLSNIKTIKSSKLHSKCDWSPYNNFKAIFPEKVFIRGVLALDSEEVLIDPGFGQIPLISSK